MAAHSASVKTGLFLAFTAAAGCQAIAGIEDRRLAPDAGSPLIDGATGPVTEAGSDGPSEQCEQYCDDALENCTGEFAVYASRETCLATCALLPAGEDDANGNTVACRARNARLAGITGETDVHCPPASPGGDGVCGENCESYCTLMDAACKDDQVLDCERKCSSLYEEAAPAYDVDRHHDGDYMQCRLVHVTSAAVDPDTHCWHSTITPAAESPCLHPPDTDANCGQYCDAVMVACRDDYAVYESKAQCQSACGALELGKTGDTVEDTVGCRRYHSYNSLEAPESHCNHAGPSGDGHCGLENCAPYCRLLQAACGTDFEDEYGSGDAAMEACETACSAVTGAAADSGYSIAMAASSGNTVQCRVLNATRAFLDPSACTAAMGGGECR